MPPTALVPLATQPVSSAHAMAGADTTERDPGVIITHPNRDKPVVQATRATVILLFLASAGLILIVTVGGWSVLQGLVPVQIAYILVYLVLAFYAGRWNRGVLPVGAALAVLLAIFALVAGPGWFERDKTAFQEPGLNPSLLGLLTLLIAPVQILLVAFAMRGFNQGWNVELERRDPAARPGVYGDHTDFAPGPA
jgi:presenilin-like A22 family membrane protease